MSLYPRLIGTEEPKISVHQWMAAFGEYERGYLTAPQIAAGFGLDAGEQAEAAEMLAKVITPPESISVGGFVTLTNVGAAYDTTNASRGLGLFRLETAGVSQFEFIVQVNKIGTGTQSWQLWNDTDSAEVAVIDDAGAAGVKQLSTVVDFPSPLGAGLKVARIRAKSTVANDDPLFFGASVAIRRIARLTSLELHEVLLLAEDGLGYTTEATMKARLGIA
jgi:hypothetical protein